MMSAALEKKKKDSSSEIASCSDAAGDHTVSGVPSFGVYFPTTMLPQANEGAQGLDGPCRCKGRVSTNTYTVSWVDQVPTRVEDVIEDVLSDREASFPSDFICMLIVPSSF